ncbi:cell division protein FtsQ [Halalkalibacillus sediminis]|uniref:Cell division protein DivIB n=1 Tax=Halalkalibacillus sediminis TaxID=2018042 RepID=A0A2I0QWR1_9BACI|nr:FtsQ-type POTRA domain-containing protein [Halalkalibacillus sediminis]PKR78540.1 cell division protein FtsQ [Halalkalibacillus sediminis]
MADKKVLSIEDRIPQLKKARKRKANRRFVIYLTVILLLVLVIIYLQSPLSHVKSIKVEDNQVVDSEEIKYLSGLSTDKNFWEINDEEIIKNIEQHPEVSQVSVNKNWYNEVVLSVQEFNRVAYVKVDDSYVPVLENGERLNDVTLKDPRSDAPLLRDFEDEEYLIELTEQLSQVSDSVTQLISEIYWYPDDVDSSRIKMYMSDGQEVIASIKNFSEKVPLYPSISSQLNSTGEGIIYIDVGAYFQPYADESEEESVDLSVEEDEE